MQKVYVGIFFKEEEKEEEATEFEEVQKKRKDTVTFSAVSTVRFKHIYSCAGIGLDCGFPCVLL